MPPSATRLVQEGVVIPPTHLFSQGIADWDKIRSQLTSATYPSRNPDENMADLQAAVAANRLGEERLRTLASAIGTDRLRESMHDLRNYATRRMREEIAKWKWDYRQAEELLDDG